MWAKLALARQLWHHFGPAWLIYRLVYAWRLRSGLLRWQIPARAWDAQPFCRLVLDPAFADTGTYLRYRRHGAPAFFFAAADRVAYQPLFASWDVAHSPLQEVEQLRCGTLRYFAATTIKARFPPDWHSNPFTGQRINADRHWSLIDDFGNGDIKIIWEPSRFSFAYDLVRAYWRTGDEQYAQLFWQAVEDWRLKNPPQYGPHWKCGQELSLRVMAWCFGLYGFLHAQATTGERLMCLAQMIAVSGERIAANIEYALSQRNNHGISEAVGLWTIGILFPELQAATRWRERGRAILEDLGRILIYDDGAFGQHSLNYQRLMLHDYLWALRLADLNECPFSTQLRERVSQATDLLYQLQDAESGRVPVYGQNDGALILPLNNCAYHDFRPVIQAVVYLLRGTRTYTAGPWDEDLLWLFGTAALQSPRLAQPRIDLCAEHGGYYTLRDNTGFAFIRCATFRDRPGQADMLHLDLWWHGQNIAMDAGTYSYNAAPPWNDLGDTAFHNTVTVDNLSQMDRVSPFLWLPWLHSHVRCQWHAAQQNLAYWEGTHNGYGRLSQPVSHRRGIIRAGNGCWLVLDYLDSSTAHSYRLHWLFPNVPHDWDAGQERLTLHTSVGAYYVQPGALPVQGACSLVCADQHTPRGWSAPHYFERMPALSLDLTNHCATVLYWTFFSPEPAVIQADAKLIQIDGADMHLSVELTPNTHQQSLVSGVLIQGQNQERLRIPL